MLQNLQVLHLDFEKKDKLLFQVNLEEIWVLHFTKFIKLDVLWHAQF